MVQLEWSKFFKELAEKDPLPDRVLVDRHIHASIGSRKPDDVMYAKVSNTLVHNEMYILAVGQVKKRRANNNIYTNEEQDQIVSRLPEILEYQPLRNFLYGCLMHSTLLT